MVVRSAAQLSIAAILSFSVGISTVRAEDFTGKTAAYVDWAVKNCEAKSTEHEHKLVEQANAGDKNHDAFQRQYMIQFQAKEFADASAETKARTAECDSLKEWYGPAGSRLAGLIAWDKSSPAASGAAPAAAARGGKQGRRRGL